MNIIIKEDFKEDYTTRVAGERLREMILSANEQVILDFNGVKVASASFFDEGIAKLSEEGWNSEKVKENLAIINLYKKDLELLKSVCSNRNITFIL